MTQIYTAIGLMSGTSLDAVDAALIETDGHAHIRALDFITIPYDDAIRGQIRAAYGITDRTDPRVLKAEALSTTAHIDAVKSLITKTGITPDLIGYHGQTTYHNPAQKLTIQLGLGQYMADTLGIQVVYDMRAHDVSLGGQGAPLAPLYHRALLDQSTFPAIILNIGGVGNITYIDHDTIIAFDTGPGNALMDDWIQKNLNQPYDTDGKIAASGTADNALVQRWLASPYFTRIPPKSLDRDEWDIAALGPMIQSLSPDAVADGAATLLQFTAQSILKACDFLPASPKNWYAAGGGRHNKALMDTLKTILPGTVHDIDVLGWDGDAIEAQCFAYLGVRSLLGLPLSLPTTTGVPAPATGGILATPQAAADTDITMADISAADRRMTDNA